MVMEREIGIAVWASRLWRKVLVRSGRLLMSRRATSNEKPLLSAAGGGDAIAASGALGCGVGMSRVLTLMARSAMQTRTKRDMSAPSRPRYETGASTRGGAEIGSDLADELSDELAVAGSLRGSEARRRGGAGEREDRATPISVPVPLPSRRGRAAAGRAHCAAVVHPMLFRTRDFPIGEKTTGGQVINWMEI